MWRIVVFILLVGCSPVDQESVRRVAAIEVPLRGEADRADLLSLLQRHAERSGLHLDDGSEQWRQFEQEANLIAPQDRLTFNVGVWRGHNDDENEALADDRFHPGRVGHLSTRFSARPLQPVSRAVDRRHQATVAGG
jgi:hypothetical protein